MQFRSPTRGAHHDHAPSHTNLPACPPWCRSPAGHPYEGKGHDGTLYRYHQDIEKLEDPLSKLWASIVSEEQALGDASTSEMWETSTGPAVQMPARIHLWTDDPALTAEEDGQASPPHA